MLRGFSYVFISKQSNRMGGAAAPLIMILNLCNINYYNLQRPNTFKRITKLLLVS